MSTDNDVYTLVNDFIRDLLPGVDSPLPVDAGLAEIGVDSMSLIDLFFTIERRYGIEIPDSVIPNINTVGELIDFVDRARAST